MLGLAATAGLEARPQAPQAVRPSLEAREVLDQLVAQRSRAPLRSADGTISVGGPALSAADSLHLIRVIEQVRGRLRRVLGLPLEGASTAIAVWAVADEDRSEPPPPGEQDPPDRPLARLRVWVAADRTPPIRLLIENPEELEPQDLTRALCGAWLRADALANGWVDPEVLPPQISRSAPYPAWFGHGIARGLDPAVRQADAEATLERWSRAELPPVSVLLQPFSPYADADPALAAQLAAWLLDSTERSARLQTLRDAVIAAGGWSVPVVEQALGVGPERGTLGTDWDLWLLERRWAVLTPGVTPDAFWSRTPSQLLVRPGNPGTPLEAWHPRTPKRPAELIEHRRAAWMPSTASRKVFELQRLAVGRDEDYRHMAAAYTEFFVALQRGVSARRLRRALRIAEERFEELTPPGLRITPWRDE